jgi:PST family polysaccharide transporter
MSDSEPPSGPAPAPDIGARAVKGAVLVAMSQGVKVIVTLVSTIVVARLLSPHDYGIVAMTAPVVAFLQVFQTLGLNQAMVQRPTISDAQFTAMFWMNIGASAAIAAGLVLAAPLVAAFYHEPAAGYLCAAMGATVLVTGGTLQHAALLNRGLRFGALSGIEIVTHLVTLAATAAAAYVLRSYWALWLGPFIAATVNVILLWTVSPWRPGRTSDFKGSREMLRFGADVTGFNLINFFGRNLDNVLIARVWGSIEVGLYDRAYKLMMFPLQNISNPIGRLMIPILSRVLDQPDAYRRLALNALRALFYAVLPAIAVAVASPERLVVFLLGPSWSGAAPVFFWLSLAGMTQVLTQPMGWLFVSAGRGRDYVRWGLVSSLTSVASFAVGLPWKSVGVAAAYCLSDYLIRAPFVLWWVGRASPVKTRDLVALHAPFLVNALAIWGLARVLEPRLATVPLLAVEAIASYGLCAAFQVASPDGRRALGQLAGLVLARVRRRRGTA